jgi:ectoine hydroxylase-related dioxygenase (phytanoyl-CoA dioxygenase family)
MSTTTLEIPSRPVELPYRYEFETHELSAIKECCDEHGFAIVKRVLTPEHVEELKQSIRDVLDPEDNLELAKTRVSTNFIELSPPLWKLFENEAWLKVQQVLHETDQLTVHRTAAILKNTGTPGMMWHTDWAAPVDAPQRVDQVLNSTEAPAGMWFYLTGNHPRTGGLAVIADSHRPDWPGPEGFELTPDRRYFYPVGHEHTTYSGKDVPGLVPLFTDPVDMIAFSSRTYHGVYDHQGEEARLSCAIILRGDREPFEVPWELPESARRLKEEAPAYLRPYLEHYTGLDRTWKPSS